MADDQTRLLKLYDRVSKSADVRPFFTHLFNYIEFIKKHPELNNTVKEITTIWYALDNLDEINPPSGEPSQWTNEERRGFVSKHYIRAGTDFRGATRPYFCWARLDYFYSIYSLSPNERFQIPVNSRQTKKITSINRDLYNIFRKNDDTDNTVFIAEDYRLYAEVFHDRFSDWLSKANDPEEVELIDVTFGFDGSTVPIVRDDKYEYRFEPMRDSYYPWKIIHYCWKNSPNKQVNFGDLKDSGNINTNQPISELLRKSPMFKPDTGVLSVFVEALPRAITVYTKRSIPPVIFEAIKAKATRVPISE